MDKKQLQRIESMETRFDSILEKVNILQKSLDAYEAVLPEPQELISYYDSGTWRQDYPVQKASGITAVECHLCEAESGTARMDQLLPSGQHERLAEEGLWAVDAAQGTSGDSEATEETTNGLY